MITRTKVLSVAFTAALIGGTGLGTAGAASAVSGPAPLSLPAMTSGQTDISIENFTFSGPGTVNPSGEITVTNNDTEVHTVTADDGSFDVTIPGGTSATFAAPSTAGTDGFFCKFHGNMRGSLTVGAEAMAPAPEAPAPEVAESGGEGRSGMDQMGAVPKGGADTGASGGNSSEGSTAILLGGGLVLLAAAGGTYAVRRRSLNH